MGVQVMVFTYILGRTDPQGRTVIDMWADSKANEPLPVGAAVGRRHHRPRQRRVRRGLRAAPRHEMVGSGECRADRAAVQGRIEPAEVANWNNHQVHNERGTPDLVGVRSGGVTCPTRATPSRSSSATCSTSSSPTAFPDEMRNDLTRPFELVFGEGCEQGLIDRPVEIVFREVEGLPKGTIKAVIDAYGELVDEGCLAVFGPRITDNAVPTRGGDRAAVPRSRDQRVRRRGVAGGVDVRAPAGLDDRRADLLGRPASPRTGHDDRRRAHRAVAGRRVLHPGTSAAPVRSEGIQIVAEEWIAQTAQDIGPPGARAARRQAHRRSCTAASASGSCS